MRTGGRSIRWNLLGRIERKLKWATAPLGRLTLGKSGSIASAVVDDALLTLQLHPVLALGAAAAAAFAAGMGSEREIRSGLLPIAFAALSAAIAEIAARDARGGTLPLLHAVPRLRERFVAWKLASTMVLAFAVLGVPLLLVAIQSPLDAISVATGIFVLAGAATFLGIASSNPKTFIVLFLVFWSAVVNDSGHTAALDFANFYGPADPGLTAA